MYRYFLGAFGNKSFIRPQYDIMEDGKLRGIEDRWGEFPNGGTVSLTGISDSDTESIKNRLLQFKIDFNRDLHPGYAPYTDNSNKYQIPFNAIDDFDKDEVVEIIDIDYAIEDFINDKTKRTIRIKHRPNKQILLRYAQDCYGPFEFMISDIEDSYGDESLTGWLTPRWPYLSLVVFAPMARLKSWCPRQMPKIGMLVSSRRFRFSMISTFSAGSPGPLDSMTPSNLPATSSGGVSAGMVTTSQPRFCSSRSILYLTP